MPPVAFVPVDFDEQTADDWDVDMSVYYDRGTERGVAVPGRSCALVLYTSHTCLSEAKLGDQGQTTVHSFSVCPREMVLQPPWTQNLRQKLSYTVG